MKHQGNERSFKYLVCGMEVSRMTAREEFEYQARLTTSVPRPAERRSRRSQKSTFGITTSME